MIKIFYIVLAVTNITFCSVFTNAQSTLQDFQILALGTKGTMIRIHTLDDSVQDHTLQRKHLAFILNDTSVVSKDFSSQRNSLDKTQFPSKTNVAIIRQSQCCDLHQKTDKEKKIMLGLCSEGGISMAHSFCSKGWRQLEIVLLFVFCYSSATHDGFFCNP